GIQWRKKWFPAAILLEQESEKIMRKQEGLMRLKEHIYQNHALDWRYMVCAFACMKKIIMHNVSEDIQSSAYFEKISKKSRIKITQFVDPTPLLNPKLRLTPFLNEYARYAGARFLAQLCKHQDVDIADDVKRHISEYQKIEKCEHILKAYADSLEGLNRSCQPNDIDTHIPSPEDIFECYVACLPQSAIPIETINHIVSCCKITIDLTQYFDVRNDHGYLKDDSKSKFWGVLPEYQKLNYLEQLICILSEHFTLQPRRPKTWRRSQVDIHVIEDLVFKFDENRIPYGLKNAITKLLDFYQVTKYSEKKIETLQRILKKFEDRKKEDKVNSWRTSPAPDLYMNSAELYFERWKNDHDIRDMEVKSVTYAPQNSVEYIVHITHTSGEVIEMKVTAQGDEISFQRLNEKSEYLNGLQSKNAPVKDHFTFRKLTDSFKKTTYTKSVTVDDASIIMDYFEGMMCSKAPSFEKISLSVLSFITFFGFTFKEGQWGLASLDELNAIVKMKLRMSYLYHMYGSAHSEWAYVDYCNQQVKNGQLTLIPYKPNIDSKSKYNPSIEFYNWCISSTGDKMNQLDLSELFSKVIEYLRDLGKPKKTLYECALTYLKQIRNNGQRAV
ncbi:MAG: hypothetical protein Q8K36_02630, partial [Alphaproteobacteria bacterium]|nr:hypothetical protein [Alphaproteobacteria bacterium]